ncbi:MAG: GGDEF domain-containing protein [Polyangiales bacterium]
MTSEFPDDEDCTSVASRADLDAALAGKSTRQRPCLVVVSGAGSVGKMLPVEGDMVIGRAPSIDFPLVEDGVSRRHAKLEVSASGAVELVDLDSRNGTFVNGARVTRRTLHDGDKIQIGNATILKFSYQDALDEALQRNLYDSATRDGLTRVFNKKTFTESLAREFAFALRHRRPLSLIMFDVDHFKRVNDTHGHPAGDHVLQQLGQTASASIRGEDLIARVGGEEFALLLRDIHERQAVACAERLRASIEASVFAFGGKIIPVTISLGVATLVDGNHAKPDLLVEAADKNLYLAKHGGRNRVHAGGER